MTRCPRCHWKNAAPRRPARVVCARCGRRYTVVGRPPMKRHGRSITQP